MIRTHPVIGVCCLWKQLWEKDQIEERASQSTATWSQILLSGKLWNDVAIAELINRCAALEDLVIIRNEDVNVRLFKIVVPTLKSLTINNSREKRTYVYKENHWFWINAPSLQTLNIKDTVSNFIMLEFMPEVTKAISRSSVTDLRGSLDLFPQSNIFLYVLELLR
ncbi:hypothetical protein Bca4012_011110 [Brassica carinata]